MRKAIFSIAIIPLFLLSAPAYSIDLGGVIGGVAGGVVGSQFGSGSGKTAMTIGGVLVGSYLGSKVGNNISGNQRGQVQNASGYAFQNAMASGRTQNWQTQNYRGYIVPQRYTSRWCRNYKAVTLERYSDEGSTYYGTACYYNDGIWRAK